MLQGMAAFSFMALRSRLWNRFYAGAAGFNALLSISASSRVTSSNTLRITHVNPWTLVDTLGTDSQQDDQWNRLERNIIMKKQKKQSLKARDLTPLKNVTGGRHHRRANARALGLVERADEGAGLGPFGHRSPQ